MNLPIDVRDAPFKPKYVDEETPMFARWFTFGRYDDGTTLITDGTVDVLDRVPVGKAERIVAERNRWCEFMLAAINSPSKV
jgi:hypothetical protein